MAKEKNPYLSLIDNNAPVENNEASSSENPYASLIPKEEQVESKGTVNTSEPNQIDKLINASIGAGTGALTGPMLQRLMEAGLSPKQAKTPFNETKRYVEDSVQNWRMYADRQNEQAKAVRRANELTKKYPNYNPLPQAEPEKTLGRKLLSPLESVGNRLGTVSKAIGENLGPSMGGALALGSGAFNATDAINRANNNDPIGATIAGIGAVGSGLSMLPPVSLPTAVLKGVGATMATASPFALMLNDYLRNRAVKEGMAQQPQQPPQQPPQQ
jgi:hypothetical protein